MNNQDRAEVLRGKAKVLTYSHIMEAVRHAVELDDGGSEYSSDGYNWNPECYATPQLRINEAGRSAGNFLFAQGGCNRAAFECFLPAFNLQLKKLLGE